MRQDWETLEALANILEERKSADPEHSYVASLYAKGDKKIAQKVGEEAVETVIEAVGGSKEELAAESADLLYHLLVLWEARGVKPCDVWEALEGRKGISGIAEKASRIKY